jgi:glyoxylase-like metal-dependent hydrolase (beta-lactamase superfamily II)
MRRAVAALGLGILAACGGASPAPSISSAPRPEATVNEPARGTMHVEGGVGTYVSTPWSFSTSSYVLEGPDGLVAIDTQFLPSAAEDMIARAEALTKKKVVLAIVLHANPDKFNGTATFQKRGVRVVTSAQVKALLPEVHDKRLRAFYDRYAPDYPRELPAPDVFGDKTTDLSVAGLTLRLHVMGPGCSEAHVVVQHERALFVGDLVASENHSWLELGKTDAWQKRIEELRRIKPATVYPGRGPAGDASLLDAQERYLKRVISLVAAERPTMPVREDAIERIEKAVIEAYPDHGFPVFLKIGLPAEWERQALRKK